MNYPTKFRFQLLSLPALVGMMLVPSMAAHAKVRAVPSAQSDVALTTSVAASCDASPAKASAHTATTKSASGGDVGLNFSAAESDAAVILFGCDCPSCINALQQLRNQSLLSSVQGHCWTSLNTDADPQTISDVLEAVDQAETRGPDEPLSWDGASF